MKEGSIIENDQKVGTDQNQNSFKIILLNVWLIGHYHCHCFLVLQKIRNKNR